ncbi:hypothetical protein GLE_4226 [Lysobacter enzymogenes]|uniref:Uncharacterized protein n=1 Tax=Lysobacter enzymogenes TaxID=69 RepID=A0A0S2DMS1_LYSEN|nr:hypothetical protein GLE_4226 [Lysobacter enzymogenes]
MQAKQCTVAHSFRMRRRQRRRSAAVQRRGFPIQAPGRWPART